jgi:hypothetical protein
MVMARYVASRLGWSNWLFLFDKCQWVDENASLRQQEEALVIKR